MLLGEDDSALKIAQQIKFHGLVGYKPVAYKETKENSLNEKRMKKIRFEEIIKKLKNYLKKRQSHIKIMTAS